MRGREDGDRDHEVSILIRVGSEERAGRAPAGSVLSAVGQAALGAVAPHASVGVEHWVGFKRYGDPLYKYAAAKRLNLI